MDAATHHPHQTDLTPINHPDAVCLTAIRQTSWGKGLDEPLLQLMVDYVQPFRAPANTTLCVEGERGDFMAFVISGRLRVDKRDYFQESQMLAQLGPGSSFGEMALVDAEPRSASIQTVEETELLMLTHAAFQRLLTDHPDAAVQILVQVSRVLSQRIRYLNRRVLEHLA
ncbi:MAG: cyclic nucleotide-binding domain-containing protein [Myxococcota bacterium]